MLAGWALVRQLLGDEFRDENGRRMSGISAIKNWTWIRIGQQLKFWVRQGTKTALTQEILKLVEPEMASATEILSQAGVQLQGEDEDLVDSDEDTEREEDELDYLKIWDTGQGRKRTAKEVANDDNERAARRYMARQWIKKSEERKTQRLRAIGGKKKATRQEKRNIRAAEMRKRIQRVRDQARRREEEREEEEGQHRHQGGGGGGGP